MSKKFTVGKTSKKDPATRWRADRKYKEQKEMKIKEADQALLTAYYEKEVDISEAIKKEIQEKTQQIQIDSYPAKIAVAKAAVSDKWVAPAGPKGAPGTIGPQGVEPRSASKEDSGIGGSGWKYTAATGYAVGVDNVNPQPVKMAIGSGWQAIQPEKDDELEERKKNYALFMEALLNVKLKELTIREFIFLQETPESWYAKNPPKYYVTTETRYNGFYSESRLQQITEIAERVFKDLVDE